MDPLDDTDAYYPQLSLSEAFRFGRALEALGLTCAHAVFTRWSPLTGLPGLALEFILVSRGGRLRVPYLSTTPGEGLVYESSGGSARISFDGKRMKVKLNAATARTKPNVYQRSRLFDLRKVMEEVNG